MEIDWREVKAYAQKRGITRAFFHLYVVLLVATGGAVFLMIGGAIEGLEKEIVRFSTALILLLATLFIRAIDRVVTTHLVLRHMQLFSSSQR
jgi:hypothetical protein